MLAAALLIAKLAAGFGERVGIPSVLSELLTGILLGNLGWGAIDAIVATETVQSLSELGVLFLLFLVGLETDIREVAKVGVDASIAAVAGVVVPFALAFAVIPLVSTSSVTHTLFMAAALTATSVGITARVLRDCGRLSSVSGQIILGAAVIDDILGIIVLAIVASIATSGSIEVASLATLLVKVTVFGIAAWLARQFLMPRVIRGFRKFEVSGTLTVFLLALCLFFAWISEKAGLAGIIGAFTLGVILDDVSFEGFKEKNQKVEKLIKPVSDFLVPIFFLVMGMKVKLAALMNPEGLILGLVLIVCGVLGKLACGLGVRQDSRGRGGDRLLVGFGMIPRGEVGLIFAAMGANLGVLRPSDYAAVVLMVAVTTLLAPVLISMRAKALPKV